MSDISILLASRLSETPRGAALGGAEGLGGALLKTTLATLGAATKALAELTNFAACPRIVFAWKFLSFGSNAIKALAVFLVEFPLLVIVKAHFYYPLHVVTPRSSRARG